MKNIILFFSIFLVISCSNPKKDNSNEDNSKYKLPNLNDQFIGYHYSYDLKDKFGDNVIVRGKPVNVPLSKYQFLIQEDSIVFLKQTNMEDNSNYNYQGKLKVLSSPNQNPLVYSLKLLSNDGYSSVKMTLTFNLENNSIFCNEVSTPFDFSLIRKGDFEEFNNMSYGDMNYTYFVQNFINLVDNNKKETLSNLYKGYNDYIKNKKDFIEQYDDILTTEVKFKITSSNIEKDWESFGWRGIYGPDVGLDYDGRIVYFPESKSNKKLKENIELFEKERIHKTVSNFRDNKFIFKTKKFIIRLDELHNGDLRYSSWGSKHTMKDKPSLVLYNGKRTITGSGGNNYTEFLSGNIKYKIWEHVINDGTNPYSLEVYQNGRLILNQDGEMYK